MVRRQPAATTLSRMPVQLPLPFADLQNTGPVAAIGCGSMAVQLTGTCWVAKHIQVAQLRAAADEHGLAMMIRKR